MLTSLAPNDTPGVSDGTTKPDRRLLALADGSVTARTNIQFDLDALEIHSLAEMA